MFALGSGKGVHGTILVELLISGLLLAVAASVIMGGLLQGPGSMLKSEEKEQSVLYLNYLLQELKNYVTADNTPIAGAPGDPPGSWHLKGDPCGGCWALAPGDHEATALLPPEFRDPPYKATMTYKVQIDSKRGTRRVDAQLDWTPLK